MNNNFFEVKNVDFVVGGKTKVRNMSFAIENEGDVICLLGPSGIGKTTILRTIAGLQKIKNGSIKLNGKTISSENLNAGRGPSGLTLGCCEEVGATGVVFTPFFVSNWAIFPSNFAMRDSNSLFEQPKTITARLNMNDILIVYFIFVNLVQIYKNSC